MVALHSIPVPLINWDDGTVRVVGTRVLLDIIVSAFRAGATPEEIAQQYPTVTLNAVYAVIAWALEHEAEVNAYLAEREALSAKIRAGCERDYPQDGIRARLLARKNSAP